MSRTVIPVWLADYPFPTSAGEPFLSPMWDLVEEFNRCHNDLEVRPEGQPFVEMHDLVAATPHEEVPALVGCYAANLQQTFDLRSDDGTPTFTSVGAALGDRTHVHGEQVRLWDLVPAARQFYSTHGGPPAAVPWSLTTVVMVLNQGLLDAAGVNAAPTTWHGLGETATQVHRQTGTPGLTFALHGWFIEQAFATAGRCLVNADNGRSGTPRVAHLDDPALFEWAARLADLHQTGAFAHGGEVEDWGGVFERFLTGGAGIILDSSKSVQTHLDIGRQHGIKVAVAPLPRDTKRPDTPTGTTISGDALWLRSGLREEVHEGALAFSQFLLRPEVGARWHREHGFTPVTVPAFLTLTEEGWFERHPQHLVAWEELIAAPGTPASLGARSARLPELFDEAARAVCDILAGEDAGRRLATAADTSTALLRAAETMSPLTN